jgi:hypothetical protein
VQQRVISARLRERGQHSPAWSAARGCRCPG